MMNTLDYYYLVLLRGFGKLNYKAPGVMAFTFATNLFSLAILLVCNYVEVIHLGLGFVAVVILSNTALQIIYSKKRREKIAEKYNAESRESRQRGIVKVVLYELLSLALVIWACSMLAPR